MADVNERLQSALDFVQNQSKVLLLDKVVIGRFINLRTRDLYDSLVELYSRFFSEKWSLIQPLADARSFEPPPDVVPPVFLARAYVSAWFLDLYVSIRESLSSNFVQNLNIELPPVYQQQVPRISTRYDTFLQMLNSSIRPVLVDNANKNGLLIPVISNTVDFTSSNPFQIRDFVGTGQTHRRSLHLVNRALLFYLVLLDNQAAQGTHMWLFDWPDPEFVCNWIPGTLTAKDMLMSYVLGRAITANLGIEDSDAWQHYERGAVEPRWHQFDRLTEKKFQGLIEFRSLVIEPNNQLVAYEGQAREDAPRLRIVDRQYHQVVVQIEAGFEDRYNSLKLMIEFP